MENFILSPRETAQKLVNSNPEEIGKTIDRLIDGEIEQTQLNKVWDFCYECGNELTEDVEENKDWFEVRNCGESYPVCAKCYGSVDLSDNIN